MPLLPCRPLPCPARAAACDSPPRGRRERGIAQHACRYTDVRTFSANPDDPTPFEGNPLLMEYNGLNILIDGGGGGYIPDQGILPAQLEAIGLGVEDIDHILISHGCASYRLPMAAPADPSSLPSASHCGDGFPVACADVGAHAIRVPELTWGCSACWHMHRSGARRAAIRSRPFQSHRPCCRAQVPRQQLWVKMEFARLLVPVRGSAHRLCVPQRALNRPSNPAASIEPRTAFTSQSE